MEAATAVTQKTTPAPLPAPLTLSQGGCCSLFPPAGLSEAVFPGIVFPGSVTFESEMTQHHIRRQMAKALTFI